MSPLLLHASSPMINPGQVELPSIGKTSNPPVAPLEVSIRADQSLWLRDRAAGGGEAKISRNDLVAAIRNKQTKSPEQAVVIAADKDVRYETVLDVMDMLQQNKVAKVGLMVKPRSQ